MLIKIPGILSLIFLSFCQNVNDKSNDSTIKKDGTLTDSLCKEYHQAVVKQPTMIRNCCVLVDDSLNDYLNLNLPRLDLNKFNVLPEKLGKPLIYSVEGDVLYVSYLCYGPKFWFRFDKVHSEGDTIFLSFSHIENVKGLPNTEYFKENRIYIKIPDTKINYKVIFKGSRK